MYLDTSTQPHGGGQGGGVGGNGGGSPYLAAQQKNLYSYRLK